MKERKKKGKERKEGRKEGRKAQTTSHFPKLPEIWILCSWPERHVSLHWNLGLHYGIRQTQNHSPVGHLAVWSWASYTTSLSLCFLSLDIEIIIIPLQRC